MDIDSRFAHLQAIYARLFTDAALREQFWNDPDGFAHREQLDAPEMATLQELSRGALAQFARSLVAKRFGQVAQTLPASARGLGPPFREAFFQWASSHAPMGRPVPLTDSVRFVRWFLETCPGKGGQHVPAGWRGDLLRWEATNARMHQTRDWGAVQLLSYPPADLFLAAREGTEPIRRRTLAVWFRPPGGRLRYVNVTLGGQHASPRLRG